jgi:hypothetical protein
MIEKNASTQANYTFNRTSSLVMTSGIGAASRSPTRYSEQSYGIDRLEGQMILLYNNRIRIPCPYLNTQNRYSGRGQRVLGISCHGLKVARRLIPLSHPAIMIPSQPYGPPLFFLLSSSCHFILFVAPDLLPLAFSLCVY